MDATELADRLLNSVPANETLGARVTRAVDGRSEAVLDVPTHLTNVVGALHASGLAGLVDFCALAAIISAMPDAESVGDLLPLGRAAQLRFVAPARGRLTARCDMSDEAREELRTITADATGKARLHTDVTIADSSGEPICLGRFEWTVRRTG